MNKIKAHQRSVFSAILAVATASGLSHTAFAQAQTQPTGESGGLEEVVVTAQFREQNLQETPIAITAITAQMLEARSQTSVVDIANQAPNVTLKRGTAAYGPSLQAFIRGVGQNDFNFAFEPGVGMYVDDVYYSTLTGSVFDLLDLDRIEVLRGPQGTLAGMNSMGGSIKLYTKKPDDQGGGYIEATYGSYDRTDFRGGVNFTLIPNQLFARIAGVSRHEDGYVTRYDFACTHPGLASTYSIPSYQSGSDCKLGTEGGTAYDAVRLALRWTPTEDLEVNLSADTTHDRSEATPQTLLYVGTSTRAGLTTAQQNSYPRFTTAPTNGLPLANAAGVSPFISYSPFGNYAGDTFTNSPYVTYSTYGDVRPIDGTAAYQVDPVSQVSGYGFSAVVDYQLADQLKLTSISSYRRYDAAWVQDNDGTPLSTALLTYDVWHWQWSEELRLSGQLFNDRVDWVLGGFYFDQKSYYGGRVDQGTSQFVEDDLIPATNNAVFTNAAWHITDRFELNAGVRYSTQEKTFEYGRGGITGNNYSALCAANGVTYTPAVSPSVCGLNGLKGRFKDNHVDYRAVLQYQWTPGLMTYASIATGFKGGGINPRPAYPSQVQPFAPETLTAYEAGLKSDWFDRRLQANLSLFENKYRDVQRSVTSGCTLGPGETSCLLYVNAGSGRLRGAELELQVHPFGGLSIDGSVSYLEFKYTEISPQAATAGVESWMTAPFAPKVKSSVGLQYEIDVGAAGSITPRVDFSHQTGFYNNAVNNFLNYVAGYDLLNGRVTWQNEDNLWQVSLEGTNLTNKLYYTGIYATNVASVAVGSPAPPRKLAFTVKRSF